MAGSKRSNTGDASSASDGKAKPKKKKLEPVSVDMFAGAARQMLFNGTSKKKIISSITSFAAGGIQMPLAMQFFLDVRAYPLGVVVQITGDKGCRKSTLLYHIATWFMRRFGMVDITTTEGKLSPMLLESVLGYEDEFIKAGKVYPVRTTAANSMTQWQVNISDIISRYNKMMDDGWIDADGNKRPGAMYVPVFIGLDSLVAQLTEKQSEQVESQGGSDRGYATHVKAISQWLSVVQAAMTNRPYSLTLINHCTISKITDYLTEITPKGGAKTAYESTYIMYLERSKPESVFNPNPNFAPESYLTAVRAKLLKSSLGVETRRITWYIRDDYEYDYASGIKGVVRQRTSFLWGRALVELVMRKIYASDDMPDLGSASGSDDSAAMRNRLREILSEHVPFQKPIKHDTYFCSKYSDEEMDGETFGQHLENDPAFVRSFYEAFAVKPYSVWEYGTDYKEFINRCKSQSFADRVSVPDVTEPE